MWHASAISSDGSLYIWGYSKACGADSNVLKPLKLDLNDVCGIACGFNFTLAWTNKGSAYSWGSGHNGVLGHGDTENQRTPKLIDLLKSEKIVHMSAGYSHCTAITENGRLFTWGKANFSALGHGISSKTDTLVPQLVQGVKDARQASCSKGENHGHTLVVCREGAVFASGDGYKGKLGFGDQESCSSFKRISQDNFANEEIISVSAGGIHSSAISKAGHVFTWGCGSDGRLGHPEAEGHRYLFRSDTPRIVEYLTSHSAVQVSASYYHTASLLNQI